jgi:hypothetical protein
MTRRPMGILSSMARESASNRARTSSTIDGSTDSIRSPSFKSVFLHVVQRAKRAACLYVAEFTALRNALQVLTLTRQIRLKVATAECARSVSVAQLRIAAQLHTASGNGKGTYKNCGGLSAAVFCVRMRSHVLGHVRNRS